MEVGSLYTKNFTVSPEIHSGFIELFKDKNPLHTNVNFAKEKGFDSEVMHGNILNGFLSFMIGECLPIKNVIIHSQSIKYHLPVYKNSNLTCNLSIHSFSESVNAYVLKFEFLNIDDNSKVAAGKIQIGKI